MAQKGGPRLRGQRLLDNAPCQAAVSLDSGALPFPRHRALLVQHRPDRHAKGSPSGRAGERSETERASPGQESFCAAISRFFVRAILSLCFYISVSILALSVIASQCHCPGCGSQRLLRCRSHPAGRCPNSSSLFPPLAAVVAVAPKGRGFGRPGNFPLDAGGPIWRKSAGLAYGGSGFWTSAPCQAAVNLGSSALLFPRYCASLVQTKADRHAKGSPSGRAGERSETERASPGQESFCAAISRFFVRAILSLCFYISVSILALSVIASQCHLSQRERLSRSGKRAKSPPHLCGGL